MSVQASDVTYRYRGAPGPTLSNLSLDVRAGEVHALLGGSGEGKTTLLNLLSGLLPLQQGEVCIAGHSVRGVRPRDRGIAQAFQFPVLYERLNVADNLGFALRNRGITVEERRRRVLDVAERFGLQPLLSSVPAELSLQQKQLVSIARATVRNDVHVILLDEPLTAVDPSEKWRVRAALKSLQRDRGITMVLVTHDQTEALTFADRVSVLSGGQIVQTASPETLYARPDHAVVARFVGSPQMNFVDARINAGVMRVGAQAFAKTLVSDGDVTIGFRPEWAVLDPAPVPEESEGAASHTLLVEIADLYPTGADEREVEGLAEVTCENHRLRVRARLSNLNADGSAALRVDPARLLLFRDGRRLREGLLQT